MTFSFSVSITLSDADKAWLAAHAVTPIVAALNGIRDAIVSQDQMVKEFNALKAKFDSIDPSPLKEHS